TEMSSVKCNQLTDWFSRRFLCTTVYLRATCLGQLSVVFQFIVSICVHLYRGKMILLEALLYTSMVVQINLNGLYVMTFPFYFLVHLLMMVRIFRHKLAQAMTLLLKPSIPSVRKFQIAYIRLHRQIAMYDHTI